MERGVFRDILIEESCRLCKTLICFPRVHVLLEAILLSPVSLSKVELP